MCAHCKLRTQATFMLSSEAAVSVAIPIVLGRLVRNFNEDGSRRDGWLYSMGFVLLMLLVSLLHHLAFLLAWRIGSLLRAAFMGLVYRKVIGVST